MNEKSRIEAVIEMLNEHCNDICNLGLSESDTDSLLHRPSYVLNMLNSLVESHEPQKAKKS